MQRWEYASLDISVANPGKFLQSTAARLVLYRSPKGTVIHLRADKSKGDKNVAEAAFRILAEMGLDGWEMVATSYEPQSGGILYFKRPVP